MTAWPAAVFESPRGVASCMEAFLLTTIRDRPNFEMNG
jgi:hypothetical protein